MLIEYAGDEEGGRILSWFKLQLKAIATCLSAELPEACLTIVYASIDAFGLLGADPTVQDASRGTFMSWCEKYIMTRLQTVEGAPLTATDLYGARCGILHTSTALSQLERKGAARQIWYQFLGKTGVVMIGAATQMPLRLDVQSLAVAFKDGGIAFLKDLQSDSPAFQAAGARAQRFLRWGTVIQS